MSKPRLFVAGLLLVLSFLSIAQGRAADVPITHTVSFPKGSAAWMVEYPAPEVPVPAGEEKPVGNAGVKKKVEIVRLDDIRRDSVYFADGSRVEYWWPLSLPVVLWRQPSGEIRAMRNGYFEEQRLDQSAFSWVSEKRFTGLLAFRGALCRHYRMEVIDTADEIIVYQALIDNATNRPVALQVQEQLGVFTYDLPLPEQPLVMGSEFTQVLNQCMTALKPRKSLGR